MPLFSLSMLIHNIISRLLYRYEIAIHQEKDAQMHDIEAAYLLTDSNVILVLLPYLGLT